MRFTSAHLEAKPFVSVWVFQIEFVLLLLFFLFLARDQREPTTHVDKQVKQLKNTPYSQMADTREKTGA